MELSRVLERKVEVPTPGFGSFKLNEATVIFKLTKSEGRNRPAPNIETAGGQDDDNVKLYGSLFENVA